VFEGEIAPVFESRDPVRAARTEFDRKTAGFVFDPVIPPGQKPNPLGSR
jgi:hypothetical protein